MCDCLKSNLHKNEYFVIYKIEWKPYFIQVKNYLNLYKHVNKGADFETQQVSRANTGVKHR